VRGAAGAICLEGNEHFSLRLDVLDVAVKHKEADGVVAKDG
jgi:hypothetical protein